MTENEIAKELTGMLQDHDTDGDIELINPCLDWDTLGKWYAKAIKEAMLVKAQRAKLTEEV